VRGAKGSPFVDVLGIAAALQPQPFAAAAAAAADVAERQDD